MIEQLCGQNFFGGLPLAIILGASTLATENSHLAPEKALEAFKNALNTSLLSPLKSWLGSSVDQRHRSLKAALDISYQRLDEDTKIAFESLCLIPGPSFSLEAACAAINNENPIYAPAIEQLRRASLINLISEGRYTIHPIIKAYGRSFIIERDKNIQKLIEDRLIKHYQDWAKSNYTIYGSAKEVNKIDADWNNFVGCLNWCAEDPNESKLVAQYEILHSLRNFINIRGYSKQAITLFENAYNLNKEAGNEGRYYWLLSESGLLNRNIGNFEEAETKFLQALDLARKEFNRKGEAFCLHFLGVIAAQKLHFDTACFLQVKKAPIYKPICRNY